MRLAQPATTATGAATKAGMGIAAPTIVTAVVATVLGQPSDAVGIATAVVRFCRRTAPRSACAIAVAEHPQAADRLPQRSAAAWLIGNIAISLSSGPPREMPDHAQRGGAMHRTDGACLSAERHDRLLSVSVLLKAYQAVTVTLLEPPARNDRLARTILWQPSMRQREELELASIVARPKD
jgi:hypothetical protein